MKRTIIRRWITAAAVIAAAPVALQVLGNGTASAATVPSAVVTSALTAFDSSPVKTISANCPAGKKVIGGGGRVNGARHVVITELRPIAGATDSYRISASEDQVGFAGSWAAQAFAICADPLPGLQIVSATGAVGTGAFQGVTANCPGGKFAIGSGGRINGGQGEVDLNTIAEGNFFSTRSTAGGTEDLNGFGGNWSVTSFAVCVTPNAASDLQVVKVQSVSDSSERKIEEARCPAGKKVTGGTAFSSSPGTVVESVAPDANRLRIQAIAREQAPSTGSWNVTVVAFCAA
jgi:hypothetical protein